MDTQPNFHPQTNAKIKELMDTILATRFSDLDRDYAACQELLAISKKENYLYGIAFAYAYMGDCLIGKNESVNASADLFRAKDLCEKNRFLDLLSYVCTWLGIYYEMQNNRQMAMQNYLDALEFAERNNDFMRQSILLNNIASQFQYCGNYEVAKEYYIKALACFEAAKNTSSDDPHYAQLTANIISACCRLKQIDEARQHYALLESSGQLAENQNQLYLSELLISAALGDVAATRTSVDKLLLEMQKEPTNRHQFFETFLVVAESMVGLDEEAYARKMLTVLNWLCKEDEYGQRLKVQYVWMRFYKSFGEEQERIEAYKLFYELRQKSDAILNHNLAEGLLSKIKLRESVKKNQEMEKAKEQLEDEVQIDELTQLFNRRSFRKLTEEAAADPDVHSLSLIMIDVDYFKQYNDTYGHSEGDKTLRAVADCLRQAADDNVYNFRYGGDEFVSMCKNKSPIQVERFVERFCELLRSKNIPHKESLCSCKRVTLSVGYSYQTKPEDCPIEIAKMMSEADVALYWSKGQGRNCHHRYNSDMGTGHQA